MIKIYPSKLDGEPLETHPITSTMFIESWLVKNVPSYQKKSQHPISISVNGHIVPSVDWDIASISSGDDVRISVEPNGLEPATWFIIASVVLSVASVVYAAMRRPTIPSLNQQAVRKGSKIDESSARGNKIRLGGIIREIAGHFKVYPDMLLPVHRYFKCPTEQWVEMLLMIGKGYYDIDTATIKIGDTQFDALETYAQYAIYEPGESLENDRAATWWHPAPEVGATSMGGSGLELKTIFTTEADPSGTSFTLDGYNVYANDGTFPPLTWEVGTDITINEYLYYTIISDTDGDIIQGDFTSLQPFVGMKISLIGDLTGDYVVRTVNSDGDEITLETDEGDPIAWQWAGYVSLAIGYRGQNYTITQLYLDTDDNITGLEVARLTDTGDLDSDWSGFGLDSDANINIGLRYANSYGDWVGPFAVCPSGEVTESIEWDVFFPGGLVNVDNNGVMLPYSVEVEIQYRDIDLAGAWTSLSKTYTAATLDQLGYTESVNVPSARYEFKIRRGTPQNTSTQVQDTVQLYGLRARLCAPITYEGVTLMTVSIAGGGKISGQSEQLVNLEVTRKLPVREGSSSSSSEITWSTDLQPTRGIVPWMAYIAKSIGYTDVDLDLDAMDALDELWAGRGDYFDTSIESVSTVKAELLSCLKAGFAELTLDRGVMVPIRDQARTVYDHMYTPQNMVKASFGRQFTALQPDDFDGVDVEYFDSATWTKETVECRLPGDIGRKVEKITLEGITDRTRAWRFGMRQRRAHKYRRWSFQFSTEMDALNSRYLSYCALADDVPGYGQSAVLLSVEGSSDDYILESSEPFVWQSDATHVVGIRRLDGTLSGPYEATYVDEYRFSIAGLDFVPDTSWSYEPPHLIFGTTTRWNYPVLIAEIFPNADNTVDVTAMNYDDRVYVDDDNDIASSEEITFTCATLARQSCEPLTFNCNGSNFVAAGGIAPYTYYYKIEDGEWTAGTPDPSCVVNPDGCPTTTYYKVVDYTGNFAQQSITNGSSPENVQIVGTIAEGNTMTFTADYMPDGVGVEWASDTVTIDAETGEITDVDPCLTEVSVSLILGGGDCGTYEKIQEQSLTPVSVSGLSQSVVIGTSFTASGGTGPYTYSTGGKLTINATTGVITGKNCTPGALAEDTITATDSCGNTGSLLVGWVGNTSIVEFYNKGLARFSNCDPAYTSGVVVTDTYSGSTLTRTTTGNVLSKVTKCDCPSYTYPDGCFTCNTAPCNNTTIQVRKYHVVCS